MKWNVMLAHADAGMLVDWLHGMQHYAITIATNAHQCTLTCQPPQKPHPQRQCCLVRPQMCCQRCCLSGLEHITRPKGQGQELHACAANAGGAPLFNSHKSQKQCIGGMQSAETILPAPPSRPFSP